MMMMMMMMMMTRHNEGVTVRRVGTTVLATWPTRIITVASRRACSANAN